MSDEIGTNFEKLMIQPSMLAPTDDVVRSVALRLFHTNQILSYDMFSHYATKDQYNQAVAYIF